MKRIGWNVMFKKFIVTTLAFLICLSNISFPAYAAEEVVKIDKLTVSHREGGKDVNGNYTWVTDGRQDNKDHRFTFRINYATSGTHDYEPEKVEIRIPKSILNNRDGNDADYYDISVPSFDDPDIETYDGEFVFKEDGDEFVMYNIIPIPGGSNGYIEVSYLTSERTWAYKDMDMSEDFYAYMHVSQGENEDYVEAEKESNHLNVFIDTTAEITNIDKKNPEKLYRSWQDSWGTETKPQNPDDYYYLIWPIRTWIRANQPYNFDLQDIFTAKNGFVVGYSTSTKNFKETYPVQYLATDYADYSRYDYVLTAHLKATYTQNEWEVKNSVKGIVDPYDQVDEDTEATDNAVFRYKAPEWEEPTGHFMLSKKGFKHNGEVTLIPRRNYHYDSYGWGGGDSGEIRKFNLDQFKEGDITEINDLKYRVLQIGYAYPWTRNSAANDPSAFGHNPVKYVVTDNELFLGKIGENEIKLKAADANIYKLDFTFELYDAHFDEENLKFSTGRKVTEFTSDEWMDIFVETNNSGNYVKVARWNPSTGEYTNINSSYVKSASGKTVEFKTNNVTGWKIEHSNARYHTAINVYPYVTLHNTQKVMDYIGEDMKIYVRNLSDSKVFDYQGNEIVNFSDKEGFDYIIGIEMDGHIEKRVVDAYSNKVKRNYVITWNSRAYESFHDENAVFRASEQASGTFYDLVPLGGEYRDESVKVWGYRNGTLDETYNTYKGGEKFEIEDFDVSVKENYKKSGRDLVTIKINEPAENYLIEYQTVHTWNNIKDFGTLVVNDVAYETGNERIGDGLVDGSNNLFGNLDSSAGDNKKFLFSEARYDISLITNAHLNLKKMVRAASDEAYSYKTRTYPDSDYYYNIRFANSDETTATDLVVMDSLENYVTTQGRHSVWRGTLKGINLKEVENLGIKPVVYYSNVENLDLEKYKNRTNYPSMTEVLNDEIGGQKVWVEESDFGDIGNAKAFLVDLRKKENGENYVLPVDTGVSMTVAMHSPSEVTSNPEDGYKTFNNIYLWNTIMDKDGFKMVTDDLVHQDFTEIEYVVTADIPIRKVSAKDNSVTIQGTKWKLTGDSLYGNTMDQEGTTDANGQYTFKKIEAGTYTLRETYVNNDYFINPTEFTVVVGMDGSVSISDEENSLEKVNGSFQFENDVRVHGDVEFTKVSNGHDKDAKYLINEIKNATIATNDYSSAYLNTPEKNIDNESAYKVVYRDSEKALILDTGMHLSQSNSTTRSTGPWNVFPENFYWNEDQTGSNYKDSDARKYLESKYYENKPTLSKIAIAQPVTYEKGTPYKYTITASTFLAPDENWGTDIGVSIQELYGGSRSRPIGNVSYDHNGNIRDRYDYLGGNYSDGTQVKSFWTALDNEDSYAFTWVSLKEIPEQRIPNTTFKLTGTSDYGTEYNEYVTSDSRGKVAFKDIEKGEYELVETKPNDDYINPNIKYKVVIDENGNVSVTGEDFIENKNGETVLQNEAWHNFSLRKTDAVNGGYLEGAEFRLHGTDSYGKEVDMSMTSNSNGRVTFDPLASGTYILQETKPPKNYEADPKKYTVEIDRLGNVKIDGLSQDEQGFFVFPDPRGQDGKIKIVKKWNDGKTGAEANNRELPEIIISTREPEAKKGIKVTKRWEGDTAEDRPDNIIVRLVKKVKKIVDPLWGEAYAVFDSADGSLTFFRDDEGKYTNNQTDGTKTYYAGIETTNYTSYSQIPWDSNRANVKSVIFQDPIKPVSTAYWFYFMTNDNFTSITGLEKLDTSNVTDMGYMFLNCINLTTLDVSHFDTSNVTDMSGMFGDCRSLTSLDVNHFDTSSVTDMGYMFYVCNNLTTTLNVMNMPSSYGSMCNGAARASGAQITLKYIDPVTSANIDSLVATKGTSSNVVNGGEGDASNVWNENNPSPSKVEPYETIENKVVETSKDWLDHRDGTWSYDFQHSQENGDEYYVYEEDIDGYISDAIQSAMKEVVNGVVEIVNTKEEPYTGPKYAVQVYGIEQDKGQNDETLGITFGPAINGNYVQSYKSHTPTGTTTLGNAYRCVHDDDWDTIISWNDNDPYVYEQCIAEGCTHSVNLEGSLITTDFTAEINGDGPGALATELRIESDSVYVKNNAAWNPINIDSSYGTNKDGWGASRIRAMMNGFDSLTMTKGSYSYAYNGNYSDVEDFTGSNTLFSAFPSELQSAIASRKTKYDSVYNQKTEANLKTTYDKLWLLSPNEMNLSSSDSDAYQHPLEADFVYSKFSNQILSRTYANSFFETYIISSNEGIPKGQDYAWVLRSTYRSNNRSVLEISALHTVSYDNAGSATGVAPCFTLRGRTQPGQNGNENATNTNSAPKLNATKNATKNLLGSSDSNYTPKSADWGEAYAVFDGEDGSLTFFRADGTVEELQGLNWTEYYGGSSLAYSVAYTDSNKVYYKDFESCGFVASLVRRDGKFSASNAAPWCLERGLIKTVNFKDIIAPLRTDYWFACFDDSSGSGNLTNIINLQNLDTSNVTNMSSMFACRKNLTSLDISHFDTSKVTNMSEMFYLTGVNSLDLSNFDTSNVTNMSGMFYGCTALTMLDLRNFDTSKATKMSEMFRGCASLTLLDLRNFDTSNVTDMTKMFYNTNNLKTVALGDNSKFTVSPPSSNWVRYAVLSGRTTHDDIELDSLTNYDGSNPGWYKVKRTTAPNETDFYDFYVTSDDESKWVKVDDDTWEYTFDVFDDEAVYYAWENLIPDGYTTDTDQNNYQIINDGSGNAKQVTITNSSEEKTAEKSSLEIQKTIDGYTDADENVRFAFDIEIAGMEGTEIIGDTVFKDGKATVSLRHNEKIRINNLPVDTTYTVTERSNGDYPLYTKAGDTGTLVGGEVAVAKFVNKKPEEQPVTNGFKLTKKVEGTLGLITDEFEFMVSLTGLTPNKTYSYTGGTFTSNANGEAEVGLTLKHNDIIEFTGLPIGARYTATEMSNKYVPSYKVTEAGGNWTLIEKGQNSAGAGENLSTANEVVDEDEDVTIVFTNRLDLVSPTGVNVAKHVLLVFVLVSMVLVILWRVKKKVSS